MPEIKPVAHTWPLRIRMPQGEARIHPRRRNDQATFIGAPVEHKLPYLPKVNSPELEAAPGHNFTYRRPLERKMLDAEGLQQRFCDVPVDRLARCGLQHLPDQE